MNQKEMILDHINKYGSITPVEAMDRYGIMRLAARMADLREDGYTVLKTVEKGTNRYGDPVTYARYSITEKTGNGSY